MKVVKRSGEYENVDLNKVTIRISTICENFGLMNVDPIEISKKVCESIHDGISTIQLDRLSAELAITFSTTHPDYGKLASCIEISNIHKSTSGNFEEITNTLFNDGILAEDYYNFVKENIECILDVIDYNKDYEFDYFGIKTLQKAYLFKHDDIIVERPQDMWMRVSLAINIGNMQRAVETYKCMSTKHYTHATPTLYNAGTKWPQLSSCYLVELKEDSIKGIYDTLSDCAQISKWAGGIGLHVHKMRASGSDIRKNKNACSGIVPALRVFNATSRYVNQGGKRPGSIAIYLSVEHADIEKFLDLKKNTGDEEDRCRDLFYGLWIRIYL